MRARPATRKIILNPDHSPIYPRTIDPTKTPPSSPPVKAPVIFPLISMGSFRTASEFRQGKRNPWPQPDIKPASIRMKFPPKSIKAIRPIPVSARA